MKAHPYFWFVLFLLAAVGMAMAMHQDLKPSTKNNDYRWSKWMVLMSILTVFDAAMLRFFSDAD